MSNFKREAFDIIERLYPICRSITGPGLRESLEILSEVIPLELHEVPTGSQVFDWIIPDEWAIRDAYVKDKKGKRIIDFQQHNLHVLNYSIPFKGVLSIDELKPHLYSLPDKPDCIPYCTSYYEKRWGFCLRHRQLEKLLSGDFGEQFDVKIDSVLEPGSLTYAELIIPGQTPKEVLFWSYVCHPSMANHELSGPTVAAYLARDILAREGDHRYTYRFVFGPETIGSIAYIARNLDKLKQDVIAGYVVTCVGLNRQFTYLKTRVGNTLADRAALHVLKTSDIDYQVCDFLMRGSDERQFNAPGIDLPVGSLMRTRYSDFPEYHTSADDLNFIEIEGLETSYKMYLKIVDTLEKNRSYRATKFGEPQLGRYGLRSTLLDKKDISSVERHMSNLLAYSDGNSDLMQIADHVGCSVEDLYPIVGELEKSSLLEES